MRVLYLNYEWDPRESTGAMTHIEELSRGLSALGHSVIVTNRHRIDGASGNGPRPEGGRRNRWGVLRSWLTRYLHESAAVWRAIRGIREETELMWRERPDVVLTRLSLHQFSSLVAGRRCGVPVVFEVNAPAGFEYRRYQAHYVLFPKFAEWLEARMLARADGMFVVSELLKRHVIERGVAEDKIRVIPNGADVSRFRPDVADPEVRKEFGEGTVIVGFVGSFARFHGIDHLRQAIEFLAPRQPGARFLMVGSGELRGELEEYCRTQGLSERVRFTGHVPPEGVPGLMAAADILLAPYEAQDFFYLSPIKIFEYMAAGRAILAARVGQVCEVIEDGVNGLLYDPSAPESFRDRLLQLVQDPDLRRRLGESARRTIEERYTWRMNIEGVSALLEQVREKHRAGKD